MELIIYIIGVLFATFFLFIGTKNNNLPSYYLAFFSIILLGIMLTQFGVNIPNGTTTIIEEGTSTIITQGVNNYTPINNWLVNLISLVFIMGGTIMILVSTIIYIQR